MVHSSPPKSARKSDEIVTISASLLLRANQIIELPSMLATSGGGTEDARALAH